MHVRRLGGSFFSHPFWRTGFKLTSQSDVARLRSSGVPYVEIDDALGCGLIEHEALHPRSEAHLVDRIGENIANHNKRQIYQLASHVTPPRRAEYYRAVHSVTRAKSVVGKLCEAVRLGDNIPVEEALQLVEEIDGMFERGESMLLDVVRMKTSDQYTYLHSVAVCALMLKFARHIDMPAEEVRECGLAGLLHDVGKMRIPESVLHKPGPLTDEEFEVVKCHAQDGFQILQGVPDLPSAALDVARLHHEKIDGSGYPLGLSREEIPHIARMGAICDVYDALTSDRAYKAGWEPAKAIERMLASNGHFDGALLKAFAESLKLLPIDEAEGTMGSLSEVPLLATGRP